MAQMPERICDRCGRAFTPNRTSRAGRYCSPSCYQADRHGKPRKAVTLKPRQTRVPGHPIAPPSGTVGVARVVLYDKIGAGPHLCHWCGKGIDWARGLAPQALIADHLDWDVNNNVPENLVASCHLCNSHRRKSRTHQLIGEGELWVAQGRAGKQTRAAMRTCEMCGAEFAASVYVVKKGGARFCSRACTSRYSHLLKKLRDDHHRPFGA